MRGFALLLIVICRAALAQTPESKITTHSFGEWDGQAAPGVSVAVSPRNNKNMVAYAAGKLMYSNDSGVKWDQSTALSNAGAATPSLTADAKGNFYLVYSDATLGRLSSMYSTDDGRSWSEPVVISELAGSDKFDARISAHPRKESLIVTWTQGGKYGSKEDSCKTDVMMSTSGSGKKWSKPIRINQNSGNCLDGDYTLRGSSAAITSDGKIFITWAGQGTIMYDRSYDGEMWISSDLAIVDQVGGWRLDMPGFGLLSNTAMMAIDNSPSRIHGTMFMVFSDPRSGDNDTDVWLMRSVNRGDNWTTAARINQDAPGREQFLPRIAIDPANGFVYILYYDRRNTTGNQTDVYLSWSTDGGNQFRERKINDEPFTPDLAPQDNITNYIDLSVQKGLIVPVWTAVDGQKHKLWTAVIRESELNK